MRVRVLIRVQGLGREDVVLGLIDNGANVNATNLERCRPLYVAALNGRIKVRQ